MRILTTDKKKKINIDYLDRVYTMATEKLSEDDQDFLQFAMDFLKTGTCPADDAQITARQLELMRTRLRKIPAGSAAPGKTCADLFGTADGENLIDALIDLLKYADSIRVDTLAENG